MQREQRAEGTANSTRKVQGAVAAAAKERTSQRQSSLSCSCTTLINPEHESKRYSLGPHFRSVTPRPNPLQPPPDLNARSVRPSTWADELSSPVRASARTGIITCIDEVHAGPGCARIFCAPCPAHGQFLAAQPCTLSLWHPLSPGHGESIL